ncbi:hypothetical protein [Amycolatopsis benzoatilytica]|uniref:hypothetical protein n=1 Tax=Amycolatopsis benzoatilytica TaxID=346045 RepID=UPI0003658532|nr:hypothetical protein [Amycolatopsis benzoatilytica]
MRRLATAACAGAVALAAAGCAATATPAGPPPAAPTVGAPSESLRPSGSLTADQPGQVLDGLDVRGSVTVSAPNVVIERSRFTGTGADYFAITTIGAGSVTIRNVSIRGDYLSAAIAFHNWTAERVDISGMTHDGVKLGNNVRLTDSWIHDFAPAPGAHADGAQSDHLAGSILVAGNVIDPGKAEEITSAIILSSSPDPTPAVAGPVVIRDNELGGGANTLYHNPDYPDVEITGNTFRRDYRYQPIYPGPRPKVFSGNHFPDGTAVPWPPADS